MSDLLAVQLAGKQIDRYSKMLLDVIDSLTSEELWSTRGGLPNSIGNITRHLTGNLNQYFGAGLLKRAYQRHRDLEFKEKNLPKEVVKAELIEAVATALQAINSITEDQVLKPYISPDGDETESLPYHIFRMTTHFSLHVGQADFAKTILLEKI